MALACLRDYAPGKRLVHQTQNTHASGSTSLEGHLCDPANATVHWALDCRFLLFAPLGCRWVTHGLDRVGHTRGSSHAAKLLRQLIVTAIGVAPEQTREDG